MLAKRKITVIIPAHNESGGIIKVINDIPSVVDEIVVVDNDSTDATRFNARSLGATVLFEKTRGYGIACLKGIDYLKNKLTDSDIVVFLDADYSDNPRQLELLIAPILSDRFEFTVGSRTLGIYEKGSMTSLQLFGNKLATFLLKIFYGGEFTDLGPFRAITNGALKKLNMKDKSYGWTVEMQIKVLKQKILYCEVPVDYKKRIGESKVSGTFKGSIMASYKILLTIFKSL